LRAHSSISTGTHVATTGSV